MEAFELRLWDGRLGRWLTVDPYGQYFSPYLGMGNNPISRIDPDGGADGDPPLFTTAAAGYKPVREYGPQLDVAMSYSLPNIDLSGVRCLNSSKADIHMPTQHNSFGFNWTYLSESDAIGDQFINSVGNNIYMAVQFFQGKGGTGDDAFRNLDGSTMSMDDKVMNVTSYSLGLLSSEANAAKALAQAEKEVANEFIGPGLKINDNKLKQHAVQWGLAKKGDALTTEQLVWMRKIAERIYRNPIEIRQGTWMKPGAGGFENAVFYYNGTHIVVTQSDGTMITILRRAGGNKHFNNARSLWLK
ncbi:hypothetical protein NAT51_15300 [Flavobacterium amniphilum]|uniref:hypothetical protein n=1 Tax=Flavobacterium amniphilum TaxID=1834035 RepID=UPI002029C145|nr:hypothetical protein [Flavobacterium amniphilum]MCL9806901.1 hypothetical protein [Flavobacterium amniphilum]